MILGRQSYDVRDKIAIANVDDYWRDNRNGYNKMEDRRHHRPIEAKKARELPGSQRRTTCMSRCSLESNNQSTDLARQPDRCLNEWHFVWTSRHFVAVSEGKKDDPLGSPPISIHNNDIQDRHRLPFRGCPHIFENHTTPSHTRLCLDLNHRQVMPKRSTQNNGIDAKRKALSFFCDTTIPTYRTRAAQFMPMCTSIYQSIQACNDASCAELQHHDEQ